MANPQEQPPHVYDADGDALMEREHHELGERILLMPDALPSKVPDSAPRIRILWGQHLLEDLLRGRYRTLVCAVNSEDNSRGIIAQLAALLPTSQWDERSITANAKTFAGSGPSGGERVKVLKYDMDLVEVLAILRPAHRNLTVDDLRHAFKIVSEMIARKPGRVPSATVSFLGARANKLVGQDGKEPSFETVLRAMHEGGYSGDVYPSPQMWHLAKIGLFPRYPFPNTLEQLRRGGF
jgi:hypothetical protein